MSKLTDFMTGIADAIRADGKSADLIPAAEFATRIREKVLASFDANATPETILEGFSAYVRGELVEGTYKPVEKGLRINGTDAELVWDDIPYRFIDTDTTSPKTSLFSKVNRLTINAKNISKEAFYGSLRLNNGVGILKLKNITSIGEYAFYGGSPRSVWIDDTCTRIAFSPYTTYPFYNFNSNTKIYCKAQSKPSGWDIGWNCYYYKEPELTTIWGVTESEFDALQA